MEAAQGQLYERLTPQAAAPSRSIRPVLQLLPGGSPPSCYQVETSKSASPHVAGVTSCRQLTFHLRCHRQRAPMTSSASSSRFDRSWRCASCPPQRRGRLLTQLWGLEVNLWEILSLTDRSFYLITADYSSTMNGRRSDGFSSLNSNTGVKEGSLKGYTLDLLFLRPNADAGKTCPWVQPD